MKHIFTPSSYGHFWSVSLAMPYFTFVVTHIHIRWLATTCRTWCRPSPKPCWGTWCLFV